MPETITIRGVTGLRWGVDSVAAVTNALTQSASVSREPGIKHEVKDEKGFVVARIYGDDTYKLSMKAVYKGATPPNTGDFMTVVTDVGGTTSSNGDFICEKCSWEYGQDNTLMLSIDAVRSTQITAS